MELYLNHVGIIKETNILLDGLTVVTGKNSSGKTTVGKVMYSLLSAGSSVEEAFEESKRVYLCSQLDKIENAMKVRRFRYMSHGVERKKGTIEEILSILVMRSYRRYDVTQLTVLFHTVNELLQEITLETYQTCILGTDTGEDAEREGTLHSLRENFEEWRSEAVRICAVTLDLIFDSNALYNFLKDRTSAFLNHEFNEQIRPVKDKKHVSTIELFTNKECLVNMKVNAENSISFSKESTFLYPFDRCIFIDNPYVIDKLRKTGMLSQSGYRASDERDSQSMISSEDVKDHDEILCDLLMNSEKMTYFEDLELQNKYRNVFEKINAIVPGEFSQTPDGYFYVKEGVALSVRNLATGSKMFFIIKKLLLNGMIDHNTMLILDEPESHLHPEWINKFAEILVLLVKDVKVKVLLTTHSPNLLLALNVYAKKMELHDDAHFYLAEQGEDKYFSTIRCIDDCIGEGYAHLSIPLVEMNLEMEELKVSKDE